MKNKLIAGIWTVILLSLAIAIIRPIVLDNAKKVKFEDKLMGLMIGASSEAKSMEEFRKENLKEVKDLDIGYTGHYDTLVDIEKCQQLEWLSVGSAEYEQEREEQPGPESKERIRQIEKELGGILKNCSKLSYMVLRGEEKYFELKDLNFLKYGQNLEYLSLEHHGELDYSAVSQCSNLRTLDFWDCNVTELDMLSGLNKLESLALLETEVTEAGDILELKALKELEIRNTPLGGNEEQLGVILENCPNLEQLYLSGKNGELDNLEFLKRGKSIKELVLKNQSVEDYSAIAECVQLRRLTLTGCDISDFSMLDGLKNLETLQVSETNISEAKDILKLENLKWLNIVDTPLAENEQELALIYQQFPDIEIVKEIVK